MNKNMRELNDFVYNIRENVDTLAAKLYRPGDPVTIVKNIMHPWGWIRFPLSEFVKDGDHISVEDGTAAMVVECTWHSVTVDFVDKKNTLCRLSFEHQYIKHKD